MPSKREAGVMPDGGRIGSGARSETIQAPPPRTLTDGLQVISSVLMRLIVYVFLRWIPGRGAYPAVPILYTVYLFSWVMHDNKLVAYIRQAVDTSDPQQASQDLAQLARDIDVTTPKLEDKDVGRAIENGGSEAAAAAAAGKKKEAGQPSYAEVAGSSPGSKVVAKGKKGQQNEKVVVTTTKKGAAQKPIKARSTAAAPLTWTEWLRTIVLGLSSRSRKVNLWALGLHTLLLLWFLDSYAAPYLFPSHYEYNLHFARVAALGPTEAKLSFRYPHPLPPLDGILEDMQSETGGGIAGTGPGVLGEEANPEPMRVVWREASGPGGLMGSDLFGRQVARRWERGPLVRLTEEADWTATVRLAGLWPATEYEFRLAWTHNNSFTPYPPTSRRFVTFPDPRLSSANSLAHSEQLDGESTEVRPRSENRNPLDDPNHFTFAVTSCVRPDTPWLPTQFWAWNWLLKAFGIGNEPGGIAQRNRIQGFDILAEQLLEGWGHVSDGGRRRGSGLRFLLTLGDTIYADVPTGSSTIQHYRKLYRNLFASASFRRVYEAIPVFGIYDDHEVENNWAGATDDGEVLPAFPPANTAWQEYIGRGNPDPLEPGQNWYSFRYGDSAFFVTDTRLYRSPASKEDNEEKTMLGEIQREALMAWLGAVNSTSTFKFVISSVPFMSLWGGPLDVDGKKDSWAAYMTERAALLDVMQYVPNVIILSGDRHEFAAATMRTAVLEFSTSPLNMFYLPVRTLSQSHGAGDWGEDVLLKYLPDGNSKFTTLEVDTRDALNPVVRVNVNIDGQDKWAVNIHGRPVRQPQIAIGGVAASFLELLGFKPRRWF